MSRKNAAFRRGAIASCYFPLAEAPTEPGPTARPALVVGIFLDRADSIRKAIVAYGTSRKTRANMGYQIRVSHPAALKHAGLKTETRFTLSRMRMVPINADYFNMNTGNPVSGLLEDALLEKLDRLCNDLATIADPLRIVSHPPDASLDARKIMHPGAVHNIPDIARINTGPIDEFMKDHLNGRANLNGLRENPAPTPGRGHAA